MFDCDKPFCYGFDGCLPCPKAPILAQAASTLKINTDVDGLLGNNSNSNVNLFLACRFCKEVWKTGMAFEGVDVDENVVVTREEIEKGVGRLMEGPQARELRKGGMELKEAAFKAITQGGSSFTNLNKFIHDMAQLSKSACVISQFRPQYVLTSRK
ncbi:hypothetical protein SUGI_0089120 [Cryptomeria japonica]|nr:hypothetical protein SUGI_0089120 [Cryptomeria japonica]